MTMTATYSPEDNKLRLYSMARLDPETYARVKAAGFGWAPKQGLFVAPMWTPEREDLLLELAGEIGDEDTSLVERAEERADRFEGYHERRAEDAERAKEAVRQIADGIPFGQPILVGHHSERHARRDAERIENGMRKAVQLWRTSVYWEQRAAGALRHAKYKERPDVRARRIKGLEAEVRKLDRMDKESETEARLWALVDLPEKWKAIEDGTTPTREERAAFIAGKMHIGVRRREDGSGYWSAYDVLRLPAEERYAGTPAMTVDEVLTAAAEARERAAGFRARWREHYANRLTYERAMLADSGGTVTDQTKPEKGGAVRCWASHRGGWSYVQKVNRVSVAVLDNWGNGRNFQRNIPFDKVGAVMTRAQVEAARAAGRLQDYADGTGFALVEPEPEPPTPAVPPEAAEVGGDAPEAGAEPAEPSSGPSSTERERPEARAEQDQEFAAMAASLRAGVQTVTAPQLFPTPPDLARRMVELAGIEPGHRVLEPSAGTGALLEAIVEAGGVPVAVEINGRLCAQLRQRFADVREADFMACNGDLGKFDRIVMNPPFAAAMDAQHIQHARTMLKPGGRLVAICANGPRQYTALRALAMTWEQLPMGTFGGTNVRTVLLTMEA